ncbi:hypothetical protein GNI_136140 [Gregarina niphandrodes]|uniref:Uncharacterized protein n=1 Tax=Gregarina niphandrodes TaxID=110365 RepID=A0A023B124_GRENI|nr:hypothetical protein GNI_136140 [Gregarina niphandrodes]EZG45941.1 hypothetical protein GNI_136140 [Gregarina niphandrodes]|eukprot:XP_011132409.1 hypothetical protein GNI_136140 [Gregarina niphandrodes]
MSRAVSSVSGGGELALLSALKLLTEAQSVAMYATVENEKRLFSAAADPKVFSMSLCENGMIDLRQCTNHHNLVWDWAESVDVNQHKVRYTGKAKDWCKLDVSNALGQRLGRLELVREIDRNELNLEQRIYQDLKNAPPGHVYHLVFLGDDPPSAAALVAASAAALVAASVAAASAAASVIASTGP